MAVPVRVRHWPTGAAVTHEVDNERITGTSIKMDAICICSHHGEDSIYHKAADNEYFKLMSNSNNMKDSTQMKSMC